ncbi:glycosyltransferase family 4 protein [Pedobacter arcticus]|uniref:glycosyltransferase family 4 protein n=1 Tax=Pedobacter arcticus TaxID=752140 RepID=UPI0002F7DFF3|nr:glycosyltransferase family 4 protein [Pedobacter arcticus]
MKIAFIIPSLANKGPILVCQDIVKSIISKVEYCHVYYFDEVNELEFPCSTTKISFFSNLNFDKYDIVHSHMFRPDLYLLINRVFRHKKYKTVTTIHTAIYDDLKYAYSWIKSVTLPPIWKLSWNNLDQIVVLTNFAKSYYKDLKPGVEVIPNGKSISTQEIEQNDKNRLDNIRRKYKIIGTVASFDDRKGLDQVINALPFLKDYIFVVIGKGPKKIIDKLSKIAKELHVSDRILFLGERPKGDRYIPYFDIFVIPSISEGFPLALLEAAAHKAAIICSNIEVFKESFKETDVKFFELKNIKSLLDAVAFVQENNDSMKRNVYETFKNKYTPEIMADSYLRLYKKMIDYA